LLVRIKQNNYGNKLSSAKEAEKIISLLQCSEIATEKGIVNREREKTNNMQQLEVYY